MSIILYVRRLSYFIPPLSPADGECMIYLVRVMLLVELEHDNSNKSKEEVVAGV